MARSSAQAEASNGRSGVPLRNRLIGDQLEWPILDDGGERQPVADLLGAVAGLADHAVVRPLADERRRVAARERIDEQAVELVVDPAALADLDREVLLVTVAVARWPPQERLACLGAHPVRQSARADHDDPATGPGRDRITDLLSDLVAPPERRQRRAAAVLHHR